MTMASAASACTCSQRASLQRVCYGNFETRIRSGGVTTMSQRMSHEIMPNLAVASSRSRRIERRASQVVGAKRSGKGNNGGLTELDAPAADTENEAEPVRMYMGKKLDGQEPDFWEGEQWNGVGFIIQYLWAFGVLIAIVACAIAVATYNSGASDFKDSSVFKEAMDGEVEMDSSVFDQADVQGAPEPLQAPSPQE